MSDKDGITAVHGNRYDWRDLVQRPYMMSASGDYSSIRIAAYRVRDPDTGKISSLQFHATFNNVVLAVMDEHSATLFARAVLDTLGKNHVAAKDRALTPQSVKENDGGE